MKHPGISIITALFLLQGPGAAYARDLNELIPGLYGGDGIILQETGGPFPSHAPHFLESSGSVTQTLNRSIASAVRPSPLTPSAGGITYEFDPASGTYRGTSSTLGPLVAERPQTLGKGKFSLQVTTNYFEYDEFEGQSLDNLNVLALHQFDTIPPGDSPQSFENDNIAIDFDVDLRFVTVAFAGTYGVTDKLDVNLLVPLVNADLDVSARAQVVESPLNTVPGIHQFDPTVESATDSASDNATGVGDVLLGAKYYWLNEERYDVSGALRVKLETGDEDDFLGTGSTTILPFVIGSYKVAEFGNTHLNTHVNFGYEADLDDNDRNVVAYAVGFDMGNQKLTGAFDMLGRHELHGDDIGTDIVDASVGIKWSPIPNMILVANVITPVNDDGLRSDFIATGGLEFRH